jgi:hypothetical protein
MGSATLTHPTLAEVLCFLKYRFLSMDKSIENYDEFDSGDFLQQNALGSRKNEKKIDVFAAVSSRHAEFF